MKAYDETLLKNQWVQKLAGGWAQKKLITEAQHEAIDLTYAPLPYQPGWFLWIGLFVFTVFALSSALGLFALFTIDTSFAENFLGPIFGIAVFFFLNFLIKDRKLHFSGIDNAMLYAIALSIAPSLSNFIDHLGLAAWILGLMYLPLLLFLIYRYGEPLIAAGTLLTGLFVLATLAMNFSWGKLLLPFLAIMYAALIWYFVQRFLQRDRSFYWHTALRWVRIAAITVCYAAGNYFVVREDNAAINELTGPSPEVALSGIFWFLTFAIPLLYIYLAVRWRDQILLILGSGSMVASLVTLHHYYLFIPGDWASALLGLAGLVLAVVAMRYLEKPKHRFVYAPEDGSEFATLAATIVATEVGHDASQSPSGPQFGGGDFGGVGSGQSY